MHDFWTIVIDVPGVCRSVLLVTLRHCAKMAERIEVLLGVETLRDMRNIILDEGLDFPTDSMRPSPKYVGHLFATGERLVCWWQASKRGLCSCTLQVMATCVQLYDDGQQSPRTTTGDPQTNRGCRHRLMQVFFLGENFISNIITLHH